MAINGNNIIISMSQTAFAVVHEKSSKVETSCDMIEVASPSSGEWKKFVAGRKEWGFTTNYLVMAESDLTKLLNVSQSYLISIHKRDSNSALLGTAIMTKCEQTYTRGNLVQGVFTFKGITALDQYTPSNNSNNNQ